jgi:hypothetical protein
MFLKRYCFVSLPLQLYRSLEEWVKQARNFSEYLTFPILSRLI